MAWTIDVFGDEIPALAEVADLRDLRVLEVGAGDGRLTRLFAAEAATVLAIDPDAERINQARDELPAELAEHVRFEVVDATQFAAPPGSFDVALLSWSL